MTGIKYNDRNSDGSCVKNESVEGEGCTCGKCMTATCLCGACCIKSSSLILNCIQGVCNMFAACFETCSETCKGCSKCIEQVDCDGK